MIKKFAVFFWQKSNGLTLIAAIVFYLFWAGFVMTKGMDNIRMLSQKPVEILDLQFNVSPEQARSILQSYSEDARHFAIIFGLVFDTIYPLVYGFLFIVSGCLLYKHKEKHTLWFYFIPLLPVLLIIVDYAENICIALLMNNYPNVSDISINITSCLTSAKWILVGLEFVLLFSALMQKGIFALKRK